MQEGQYIHKSHNVSVLMYHFVCPAKYRRVVFTDEIDVTLKEICLEIEKCYDVFFLEIGTDADHVHFLLQSVPTKSPTQIIKMLKSISTREIFRQHPEMNKQLWGGEFWTDGYYVGTVGKHADEEVISKYVREQGNEKEYKKLHKASQLRLF